MAKLLILFGTNYGQTRKVVAAIAEVARDRGYEVELVQGNRAGADFAPEAFDAAIIGTSILMGVHQISVKKVARAYRQAFARIPCAYFCVCLTAMSNLPADRKQVNKYIEDFTGYTGLKPVKVAAFAGGLRYPEYNFIRRFLAKLLARRVGADTDTKREHEYTDWPAVSRFADDFLDAVQK